MSCDRLVLHQLESTNSIEAAKSVKTRNAETAIEPQLLGIHYCFARGLQEKAGGSVEIVCWLWDQFELP